MAEFDENLLLSIASCDMKCLPGFISEPNFSLLEAYFLFFLKWLLLLLFEIDELFFNKKSFALFPLEVLLILFIKGILLY